MLCAAQACATGGVSSLMHSLLQPVRCQSLALPMIALYPKGGTRPIKPAPLAADTQTLDHPSSHSQVSSCSHAVLEQALVVEDSEALSAARLAQADGSTIQRYFRWPRPVPLQDLRAGLVREVCRPLSAAGAYRTGCQAEGAQGNASCEQPLCAARSGHASHHVTNMSCATWAPHEVLQRLLQLIAEAVHAPQRFRTTAGGCDPCDHSATAQHFNPSAR